MGSFFFFATRLDGKRPLCNRRLFGDSRTFCDLKLRHVQFNVINKDTPLAAQRVPEKIPQPHRAHCR